MKRSIVIIIIFALILTGCSKEENKEYSCKDCNVILVSFDSLRADKLGVFGSDKNLTPNIDEFARKSLIFPNTLSNTAFTITSLTSLFTSKYPYLDFGINGYQDENEYILTSRLKKDGYTTISFVMHPLLYDDYIKGFQIKYEEPAGIKKNIDKILSVLNNKRDNEPFFMWIHFLEPHLPYISENSFLKEQYPYESEGLNLFNITKFFEYMIEVKGFNKDISTLENLSTSEKYKLINNESGNMDTTGFNQNFCNFTKYTLKKLNQTGNKRIYTIYEGCYIEMNDTYIQQYNAAYNARIKQTDYYMSKLLDYYEQNLSKNTVLIILSDHGEVVGEHNIIGHGNLYYNMIHIPLIIRIPNSTHLSINNTISMIDIAPTILKIIGDSTSENMKGESVFEIRKDYTHIALIKSLSDKGSILKYSLINDNYKYYNNRFYDIKNDPTELIDITANLTIDKIKMFNKEREKLNITIQDINNEINIDKENKLRSLGYIN